MTFVPWNFHTAIPFTLSYGKFRDENKKHPDKKFDVKYSTPDGAFSSSDKTSNHQMPLLVTEFF